MTESKHPQISVTGALVAAASAVAGISGRADEAVVVTTLTAAFQPMLQVQISWLADVLRRFVRHESFSANDFEAEVSESSAKQELLIRAIDLSRTAATEEKRAAIAASMTAGFESDLAAARENDVLRVIADLDLAHVLALRVLNSPRNLPNEAAVLNPIYYQAVDLGHIDGRLVGLEDRLIAVLVSHGLVLNETMTAYDSSMTTFRITTFGQMVLERYS
ncbi:MAG: hypothetical protein WA860_14100 [Acidimicrobiales bacterium]